MDFWTHDKETGHHHLEVDDDHCMQVHKTPGGDYALTCLRESAGFGGEVEYHDSLSAAKRAALAHKRNGTWKTLAPTE
jgi:hypothetical protein